MLSMSWCYTLPFDENRGTGITEYEVNEYGKKILIKQSTIGISYSDLR